MKQILLLAALVLCCSCNDNKDNNPAAASQNKPDLSSDPSKIDSDESTDLSQAPPRKLPDPDPSADVIFMPLPSAAAVAKQDIAADKQATIKVSSATDALDGTSVIIPQGALQQAATIRIGHADAILPPRGGEVAGPAVRLEPHGQTFEKPVEVAVPISSLAVPLELALESPVLLIMRRTMLGQDPVPLGPPMALSLDPQGRISAGPNAKAADIGPQGIIANPKGGDYDQLLTFATRSFSDYVVYIIAFGKLTPCKNDRNCNDSHSCSIDECVHGICVWTWKSYGEDCDDGNPDTVQDYCRGIGKCQGFAKECDTAADCKADSICKTMSCKGGLCHAEAANEGKACQSTTTGLKGFCASKQCMEPVHPCEKDSECDDQNFCTLDRCLNHDCMAKPLVGKLCNDGDPWTARDECHEDGTCSGWVFECRGPDAATDCDDHNPCTQDVCHLKSKNSLTGTCDHWVGAMNGKVCNDGKANTQVDLCVNGTCQGFFSCAKDADCEDEDDCTMDRCNLPKKLCEYTAEKRTTCKNDLGCCQFSEYCVEGTCKVCRKREQSCKEDGDCCYGSCLLGFCADCAKEGQACGKTRRCCSGLACQNGLCPDIPDLPDEDLAGEPPGEQIDLCTCGDPGVSIEPVGTCDWPDARQCSGWHSVCVEGAGKTEQDCAGLFDDGTSFEAYGCTLKIVCPK